MDGLVFRDATIVDLPVIVALYADDELGQTRELATDPLPAEYMEAFAVIEADNRHRLVVIELGGEVVATLQLSFLPHLVLLGGERSQIEAVRIRSDKRGSGLGKIIFEWAIEQSRRRGCELVQLTTNAERVDAQRFYECMGFRPTHIGMKLFLGDD